MGQWTPIRTRNRAPKRYMSAEECQQRAADLFATAHEMKPGAEHQSAIKEACDFRMLAEMKRLMAVPKGRNPAG